MKSRVAKKVVRRMKRHAMLRRPLHGYRVITMSDAWLMLGGDWYGFYECLMQMSKADNARTVAN